MEKYGGRRLLAAFLAVIFGFSTMFSANGFHIDESIASDIFSEDRTYAVPLSISVTGYCIQFNEYAMVTKHENSFRVKLQYFSHSIADAIQVVKPESVADAIAFPFANLKMGTFNLPNKAFAAATYPSNSWAAPEYDSWYLPQSQVIIEQRERTKDMDIGYISFDLPDLDNKLLLKVLSAASGQAPKSYTVTFNLTNAIEMPTHIKSGGFSLSFKVTNVLSNASSTDMGGRNSTIDVNRLNAALLTTSSAAVKISEDSMDIALPIVTTSSSLSANLMVAAEKPTKRSLKNIGEGRSYTSENWHIDGYESLTVDTDNEIFSYQSGLNYEDWIFGQQIKFHINTQSRINKGTRPYYPMGIVHLLPTSAIVGGQDDGIPTGADTGVLVPTALKPWNDNQADFTDNGIELRLDAVQGETGLTFSSTDCKNHDEMAWATDVEFDYYTSEALSSEEYLAYAVSFVDSNANRVEPTNATLSFPIPEDWDLTKTKLNFLRSSESQYAVTDMKWCFDYENRRIIMPINTYYDYKLNADFIFVHQATPINPTVQITEDGVYKVRLTAMHVVQNQLSMSHNAIGKTGYIEKDSNGVTLYLAFGAVDGSSEGMPGISGLTRNMYVYNGNRDNPPIQTEHLAYAANDDGSLNTDDYATQYNLVYPKRVSVHLNAPDTGNTYYVRFDIPAMDDLSGTPGDYSGSRDARLFIFNPEKVTSNPFAGYDKSIIRAKIDEAQRLVATLNSAADGARIEELAAAILTAKVAYNDANLSSKQIKEARDALAAVVGTTGGGTSGEGTPEPDDQDDAALAPGDYPTDIKLWNFSGNYASMGNAALAHDQSFVRVKDGGTAEAHLFFKALTFTGLTGHLEKLSLVTNIQRDDNIVTKYDKTPATVVSNYTGTADATDEFGPINTAAYPREVSIPVEIGKTYTTVEVFVPVMEKAVGGAGTQLARLQIDWSALGIEENPESPPATEAPIASKPPVAQESVSVTTEIKENTASGGGKIAESTVTVEQANAIASNASSVVTGAKATAAAKIAAGETVVAEIKIEIAAEQKAAAVETAKSNNVTETIVNVPKTAIAAIVAESTKEDNANVELVLTVESVLASGLAEVTLDAATLAQAVSAAGTAETVTISVAADATATLTQTQKSVVPAGKVPLSVTITAGAVPITDLASDIAITIPYVKTSGTDKKVVVYYVAADGSTTKHDASYENGRVTFTTDKL
jgi:hypothetical protein